MSSEITKLKRSSRRHNTWNVVKKYKELARQFGLDVKKPHKYAKMNPFNCGNSNCVMCGNPRKTFNQKSLKEISFFQRELHEI